MLDDLGELATAMKLINDNVPSDGFTRLWQMAASTLASRP
jgi:hypothetical protein